MNAIPANAATTRPASAPATVAARSGSYVTPDAPAGRSGGRLPPHDLGAERSVLSAALLDRDAFDVARDMLAPADFWLDAHRLIWQAAIDVDDERLAVDLTTVAARLNSLRLLARVGGTSSLAELVDATPSIGHVADHAKIVRDRSRQRSILAAAQQIVAEGYTEAGPVDDWAQRVEQRIFDAAQDRSVEQVVEPVSALVPKAITELTERRRTGVRPGVRTGWNGLDRFVTWEPGNLYVVAGRPGMGKSAFALQACEHVAEAGEIAVFVSAEMPKEQLTVRLIASRARDDVSALAAGRPLNWPLVLEAAEQLRKLPISIAYRHGATIAAVRSAVRRGVAEQRAKHPGRKLGLIAVDYVQILNGERRDGDSRENEVSALSRGLLWMAGEFGCAVLALSQLNREVEKRPDKRPKLSDLRETGALEQDAFAVLFPFRPGYYDDSCPQDGAEIIVAKNRNGPLGTADLEFDGPSTRFSSTALPPDEWTGYFDEGAP